MKTTGTRFVDLGKKAAQALQIAAIAFAITVLSGCATGIRRAPEPATPFTFAITVVGSEHSALDADATGERTRRGVIRGGASGAGGGAMIGLACGPWAMICVPTLAATGLLAGGVGGAFRGLTGLDKEYAARVNAVLEPLDQRRDFADELAGGLRASVPGELQAASGQADITAEVRIVRIALNQHLRDQLSLTLRTELLLTDPRARKGARPLRRFTYRIHSPKYPVENWLAEEGQRFDAELTGCVNRTVERMRADLYAQSVRESAPRRRR